jgi:transcription antitermination factor NusG
MTTTVLATPKEWFAVYTQPNQEKKVVKHCAARSVPFFLPIYRRPNRWKNGLRVVIETPLFPSYVFVQIDRTERIRVMELPGVHSIISSGREPIPLPSREIEALRHGMALQQVEPHAYLNAGDRALVCKGPFAGMSGIVLQKKNGLRLVLSLELIQKSVCIEIDAQDLEPTKSGSYLPLAEIDSRLSTPAHESFRTI